jgi:ABC-type transport system involved in cytochrome bd biosynthesis fused ATPase/permease subunit
VAELYAFGREQDHGQALAKVELQMHDSHSESSEFTLTSSIQAEICEEKLVASFLATPEVNRVDETRESDNLLPAIHLIDIDQSQRCIGVAM